MARDWNLETGVAFTDCINVKKAIHQQNSDNTWRENQRLSSIKQTFDLNKLNVELIPKDWNCLSDKLAAHGRHSHTISLFHRGLDLPR